MNKDDEVALRTAFKVLQFKLNIAYLAVASMASYITGTKSETIIHIIEEILK